jgi:hypothetical protein
MSLLNIYPFHFNVHIVIKYIEIFFRMLCFRMNHTAVYRSTFSLMERCMSVIAVPTLYQPHAAMPLDFNVLIQYTCICTICTTHTHRTLHYMYTAV